MVKGLSMAAVAAALLIGTSAASAQTRDDNSAEQREASEKRICKSERITGSLTRVRRTCLTQAEWDRLAESSRNTVNNLDREGNKAAAAQSAGTLPGSQSPNGW